MCANKIAQKSNRFFRTFGKDLLAVEFANTAWPRGYKTLSCSTQLSMKFELFIKGEMMKNKDCSCFKTLRCCIYPGNKC